MKINNRTTKRPTFVAQYFTQKSMVIPGQDLTPLEILNKFRSGLPPKTIYLEGEAHNFTTMNQIEKLDFVHELRQHQERLKSDINRQIQMDKMENTVNTEPTSTEKQNNG